MLAIFSDYFDLNKLMGMLPNSSEHGREIDQMLNFCHWFMVILFALWFAFYCTALIKFRKGRNPKADYHGLRGHVSSHLEVSVIILEAVILFGLGLPLWAKRVAQIPDQEKSDDTKVLKIRAIGFQFGWQLHYAGADGKFGRQNTRFIVPGANPLGIDPNDENSKDDAVVLNNMHLVNGKATIVRVSSLDVIHGFALHQMRVQQDAIPGTEAPMWFRPVSLSPADGWQIICAQLCGAGHPGMIANYFCDTQKDYDAWYKDQMDLTQSKLADQRKDIEAKEAAEAKAEAEHPHSAEHGEAKH